MAEISVTKPSQEELEQLGVSSWPIWTCDVSKFDWHYDQKETCYVLEGQVTVEAGDQNVSFGPGDMVVFPEGLDCVWNVGAPVRKHYKFG
jgi:uncharacterized cupin superfamily protein